MPVRQGAKCSCPVFQDRRQSYRQDQRRVSVASDGTEADNWSFFTRISADGRFVGFESKASNIAPNDTNGQYDIFIHDLSTHVTERVSMASDGTQGNKWSLRAAIASDGRFITFRSEANNLVDGDTNNAYDIFLHDRNTGITKRVSVASDNTERNLPSRNPAISSNGEFIVFHSSATNLVYNDTNDATDAFVHNHVSKGSQTMPVPSTLFLLFSN
ncbi:MAG TPA: hypothetical protein EYG88_12590 [Desulfocapsa sulfexigens]|nr:hypothetical protein [Desulfocapsa sulfexigens]